MVFDGDGGVAFIESIVGASDGALLEGGDVESTGE